MKMKESWASLLSQLNLIGDNLGNMEGALRYAEAFSGHVRRFVFYDDVPSPNQYLAHYTTWERTLSILDVKDDPVMRMYNYEGANDPQEGMLWRKSWEGEGIKEASKWLDEYLPGHERVLIEKGESVGRTYGCSFSSSLEEEVKDESGVGIEDNLTYWRLYGNDGEGCSFGLSSRVNGIYRVRYLQEDGRNIDDEDEDIDQEIARRIKDLLEIGKDIVKAIPETAKSHSDIRERIVTGLRQLLNGYNHLAKSSYFKDEREWRKIEVAPIDARVHYDVEGTLVKRYVDGPPLKDFLMITGSSITIGPQVPNLGAARAYIKYLIRKHEMNATEVRISKQSYRSGV